MDTDDTRISFDTDNYKSSTPAFAVSDEIPKMVKWVIKLSGGAIQDQRQAEYILLGFVIIAILIAVFLFFSNSPEVPLSPPTPFQENNL